MTDKPELNIYQQAAVDYPHDKPAVVTAAAGSGKTTLLVQRVIRLLSDPALGISADETVIMTFTRNATKSMREKLSKAITEELASLSGATSAPERERYDYLKKQLFALRRACISTIDAFCLRMLKENAESFDLPVNLAVADSAKEAAMQSQALKAAMSEFYGDDFSDRERDLLFFSFSFESDDALSETLRSVAVRLSTCPDPDEWIRCAESVYKDVPAVERHFLPLLDNFLELNVRRVELGVSKYVTEQPIERFADELNAQTASSDGKKNAKADTARKTRDEIIPDMKRRAELEAELSRRLSEDFAAYRRAHTLRALGALSENLRANAEALPKPDARKGSKSEHRTRANNISKEISAAVESLLKPDFDAAADERSLPAVRAAVKTFFKLLKIYMNCYELEKRASGCIDFADCERELYRKLSENGGDNDLRKSLAKRFKCVIVDEFQDSNDIQSEIFRLLGEGRLFYVGDVKQSIYAFRGADPYIMARLCDDPQSGFEKLPLNTNYRSRKAVIDTVNAAFSGLMTQKYGGTDYADGNELNQGLTLPEPKRPELYRSEILLLKSERAELSENETDRDMTMPRFVARKILDLCSDGDFLLDDGIDERGERRYRRAEFSDFMILLRSKSKIDCYRKALAELGIPSAAPKGSNFFEADEVMLVCSYLKIVDDPLLDEELLKVMMSPVYRFTAEETARIKTGTAGLEGLSEKELREIAASYRKLSLYTCLGDCVSQTVRRGEKAFAIKRNVPAKLERFYNDLRAFRYFMSSCSLDDLVRKIYEDTDLISVVAAFEDCEGRVENIRRMQQLAADFEARGGGNLGDLLRFLDRARENASKGVEEASRPKSSADSVSIMTFHGSKGLEAPVCIMTELQNGMNSSDYSGDLLISAEKYIAIKHTDIKNRRKTKPASYTALSRFIRERQLGEELRLLYVAMTRAREKLIMVSSIGKKDHEDFGGFCLKNAATEPYELIYENASPFRCVLGSLLRKAPAPDGGNELTLGNAGCVIAAVTPGAAPDIETAAAEAEEPAVSEKDALRIAARLDMKYAHFADTLQQAKYTTTELAHQRSAKPISLTKPDFARGKTVSGVEKGNAYHHCMQHFPLGSVNADMSLDELKSAVSCAVDGLVAARRITPEERQIVSVTHIAKMFASGLGRRMLRAYAADPDNVRREQSFYAEVNANEVRLDYSGRVSIQGQIDVYFIENGEIIVVDYKSDTAENLEKERRSYEFQVEIYRNILIKLTGMSVGQMYLYSFDADKELLIGK